MAPMTMKVAFPTPTPHTHTYIRKAKQTSKKFIMTQTRQAYLKEMVTMAVRLALLKAGFDRHNPFLKRACTRDINLLNIRGQ